MVGKNLETKRKKTRSKKDGIEEANFGLETVKNVSLTSFQCREENRKIH